MTLLTDLDAPALRKIIEGQIDEIEGLRSEVNKWRQIAEAIEATNRGLWQKIKTAPHDGRVIWLRFGQDHTSVGQYVADRPRPWLFFDTDGPRTFVNYAVDGPGGPSHWQPLPVPL